MIKKVSVTRTYGPIHFEDLDPKRFEDLIRQLIYDYKNWQSIEATGRGGNDDGFDIRAYEKVIAMGSTDSDEESLDDKHPMTGNLWMIQVKREKVIGPKRITEILNDVKPTEPPYGYILAASANFSKTSYDRFRDELKKKGVMEFYLWGKPELEDMLHLPKNDRILFTFFGISLISKNRSRSSEIRFSISNKNRLFTLLGTQMENIDIVLIRDSNDMKYPNKNGYHDFESFPRWKAYRAIYNDPLGLICHISEYYAYVNMERNEYDVIENQNLASIQMAGLLINTVEENDTQNILNYWEHLPIRHQATYFRNGLIRYDEILVIDGQGDLLYSFPHLYVDFQIRNGPFSASYQFIEYKSDEIDISNFKKVDYFPKNFPAPKVGILHTENEIKLEHRYVSQLGTNNSNFNTLYESDGKYSFLSVRDGVKVSSSDKAVYNDHYIRITYKESVEYKNYIINNPDKEWDIKDQLGYIPKDKEKINAYEFVTTWKRYFNPE